MRSQGSAIAAHRAVASLAGALALVGPACSEPSREATAAGGSTRPADGPAAATRERPRGATVPARLARVRIWDEQGRRPADVIGLPAVDMARNGERLVARELIDPGDLVVDVGAHVGAWSGYVLAQHPGVRLIAFEPTPASFAALRAELAGTGARPERIALSDEPGTLVFHTYPKASQLNSFYDRVPGDVETSVPIEVEARTLDGYCAAHGIERIDFLKIDTEGAELRVLRGASGLLARRSIGIVQLEYGGAYRDAGITLEQVFALLEPHGYRFYRLLPAGLARIDGWEPRLESYRQANYLAVAY